MAGDGAAGNDAAAGTTHAAGACNSAKERMARVVGLSDAEHVQWNGRIVYVASAADSRGIVEVSFDGSEAVHFDWFDMSASYWFPRAAFVHMKHLEWIAPQRCRWCDPGLGGPPKIVWAKAGQGTWQKVGFNA